MATTDFIAMRDTQEAALEKWASSCIGEPLDRFEPIPPDAGLRRYYRVYTRTRTYIASRVPPTEAERKSACRFIKVQALLHDTGVRVPAIIDYDIGAGFILVSDLGYHRLSDNPRFHKDDKIWGSLLNILQLQVNATARANDLTRVDAAGLLAKMAPLFEYYRPTMPLGVDNDPKGDPELRSALWEICTELADLPATFQHTDFHARNLIVSGAGLLGVVDFQDAALTAPYIDIAAAVFDQNFDRSPEELQDCTQSALTFLRSSLPKMSNNDDLHYLYTAGLYWNTRLLGVCTRLGRVDGKLHYLKEVERALRNLGSLPACYLSTAGKKAIRLLMTRNESQNA